MPQVSKFVCATTAAITHGSFGIRATPKRGSSLCLYMNLQRRLEMLDREALMTILARFGKKTKKPKK
jgi:hypothetical protein